MPLARIKPGDIVLVDVKGRRCYAIVAEKLNGGLRIDPFDRNFTWRHVNANQVVAAYRRLPDPKPRRRS